MGVHGCLFTKSCDVVWDYVLLIVMIFNTQEYVAKNSKVVNGRQ